MKKFLSLLTGLYLATIIIAAPVSSTNNKEYGSELDALKTAVETADSLIKLQGLIESKDNGEYKTLKASVEKARELLKAESTSTEVAIVKTNEINILTTKYRKQYLYVLIDSISDITTNGELKFTDGSKGWKTGYYPEEKRTEIIEIANNASNRAEEATTLTTVSQIIADLENGLKALYNSRIAQAYKLPLRFNEENGLPGENIDGNPSNSFIWDTPLIYLNEPTDKIRITVTRATLQTLYAASGTVIFCLAEFELYDEAGKLIPLREDMFETNSLCSSDGGGIKSLVDGKHSTWYHSAYQDSHDITPKVGEYSYVQVNLDEKISAFRYRMVGRPSQTYNRAPVDLGITAGTTYDPDNVPAQDQYNFQIIEKITDITQITDGDLYILYGNAMKFNKEGDSIGKGSGYYAGLNIKDNKKPLSSCLFTFEDAGNGKYHLHYLSENYYIKAPTTYESANSTLFKKEAASFTIEEHDVHDDLFTIYHTGIVNDEYNQLHGKEAIFPLQDWKNEMGTRPISSLGEQTEFDGQSDWEIYRVSGDNFELLWLQSV
ncbi:MAG: hypothetical protein IIV19_06900, partial [Bacteroidaceae bacterium]|nr:hypothetical protein [Bacteroidaceae bacterium]